MSIEKIRNIGLDKLITQVYDFDSLTTDELLCKFAQKINIIIEHLKYIDDRCYNSDKAMEEKLQYLLGQGLEEQVAKRLIELINNGVMGKLINETLLKEINDKVDNIAVLKPNGVDDTNNIVNILNTQKRIKLLDGVFKVTNIKLSSDVELIGSNNTTIELIGKNGVPCLYGINASNIKISNIIFDGKDLDLYGFGVISLFNTTNSIIEECKFNNVFRGLQKGSVAIDLEGSSNNIVRRNKITNSGYGICVGTRNDDISIDGQTITLLKEANNNITEFNYIHTTSMDGIFISASLNTEVTSHRISDNIVRFNEVYYSDDLGIESSRNSDNCIIEGNTVIGSKGANIFVRGGNKNIVKNNISSKAKGVTGSYYSGGIAVSEDFGTITSCIIKNNECFNNTGEGIMVGIVSDKAIKISNNKCYNNDVGLYLGMNAKGCRVLYNEIYNNNKGIDITYGTSNVAGHTVKFNSIYDNSNVGIVVNGERNNIQFNDVAGNAIGVSSDTGTTCNFNVIKNNDLTGNTTNLQLNGNGTSNIYVNNDGVTDEPKILLSNQGKGYINEVYIDNSTNQLCWNKDGSVKKVQLT